MMMTIMVKLMIKRMIILNSKSNVPVQFLVMRVKIVPSLLIIVLSLVSQHLTHLDRIVLLELYHYKEIIHSINNVFYILCSSLQTYMYVTYNAIDHFEGSDLLSIPETVYAI